MWKYLIPAILWCQGTALAHAEPAREQIGVILPLSGDLERIGRKLLRGIELASENFDEVELVVQDGEFDNKKALSAYHQILSRTRPRAILGPFGPAQTFPMARLARAQGVVLIAASLCHPGFAAHDNVFCIYPSIKLQLQTLFALLDRTEQVSGKKMAIFAQEYETTDIIREELRSFAERNAMTVMFDAKMPPKSSDFRSQLSRARGSDLFVAIGEPQLSLPVWRQLREMNISPAIRWWCTEYDEVLLRENKELLEGIYFAGWFEGLSQSFQQQYRQRFGELPDVYAAIMHDAALTLFQALRGSSPEDRDLAERLRGVVLPEPAAQGFRFTSDRTVHLKLVSTRVREGKLANLE